jgi:putative transposase
MTSPIYCGYRFPVDVIHRAIWLYLRFTLSYRDVEELLAERGITVSYETIRRWVTTFGPQIAGRLRARRPVPHRRWHLDEMFVRIGGKQMYLWRAVDAEGEVLEVLVRAHRDHRAAAKLMRKLLKRQGLGPIEWVSRRSTLTRPLLGPRSMRPIACAVMRSSIGISRTARSRSP